MRRAFFHQCEAGTAPATRNSSPSGSLAAAAAAGAPRCEYDVLESELRGLVVKDRRLYLTGHSIGAGLAAVLAQALHARCAHLSSCTAAAGFPRLDISEVPIFELPAGLHSPTDHAPAEPNVIRGLRVDCKL